MPLDYATLRVIWWILLGALLIGFAVMDGFDLGIGILLHRVAKSNLERRIVINSIGPVWEGNQVWLILGGGAIFAAWPMLYGVSFSGFYFAMLLILVALILRPVGFKYRSKIDNEYWRHWWDIALFFGGLFPTLLFGVAVGNVIQGVPFHFDQTLRVFYTGTLFELLNPFALLCGLVSVAMLTMHGSTFLANKTINQIKQRAINYGIYSAYILLLLFSVAGIWIAFIIKGYALTSTPLSDGPSNPLHKQVITISAGWLKNYYSYPWLITVPLLGFLGPISVVILLKLNRLKLSWLASALSITGIISNVGITMFPFILPSSSHPDMSLLVWDASSSQLTLFIMLIATAIFLPLILLYTSWVYRILRGTVTSEDITNNTKAYY